jgi:hypothetical protein
MLQPLATRRSGARAASVSRAGGRGRRRRRVERRRGRCSPQHKAAAALTPQSRALAAGPGKRQPPEPLTRIPARTRRQGSPGATAETSHSPIGGRGARAFPLRLVADRVADLVAAMDGTRSACHAWRHRRATACHTSMRPPGLSRGQRELGTCTITRAVSIGGSSFGHPSSNRAPPTTSSAEFP